MRSHAPDDSAANPSASNALDEFAAEDRDREKQPDPTLPLSGSLLEIGPAEVSRSRGLEPFSRLEAREVMRRNRRQSPGRRFAVPVVAVWDSITEACTTIKDRARRASTAVVGRVAGATQRSLESAANASQLTSRAVRDGRRAARRLALLMQGRAAASRARMVSERETIKTHANHGFVALAQTLSSLAFGLRRQAAASKERTSPLVREGRAAVHRFALLAWSRCVAAAKSMTALGDRAGTAWADRWTARSRALPRPLTENALEHQEFNGFVVAIVLAAAVVGYGGLLLVFSRTPANAPVKRVTVPMQAREAQAMTAMAAPVTGDGSVVPASAASSPAVVPTVATDVAPRPAFTPSARTLTALWQRRDTRSLDRAFSTLRGETLAFRSCGMRMTDADRAVARCQGVVTTLGADGTPSSRSAIWTINFRRTGGRWLIARVATR